MLYFTSKVYQTVGFESHHTHHLKDLLEVFFLCTSHAPNKVCRVLTPLTYVNNTYYKRNATKNVTFSHVFLFVNGVLHHTHHLKDFLEVFFLCASHAPNKVWRVLTPLTSANNTYDKRYATKNVTFSHVFLLVNGVLHHIQIKKDS